MTQGAGPGGLGSASGWGIDGPFPKIAVGGLLGLLLALLLGLCVGLPGDDDDADEPTPTPSAAAGDEQSDPTETASATAVPDETSSDDAARSMRVGNIELELKDARHPYDTTQHAGSNTANVRIDLEARAIGDGGGYFTAFELTLADDAGEEHPNSSCLDCPGNLDSLELGEGESGEGSAYFELPEGRTPSELIYRGSASGEEGRIDLE